MGARYDWLILDIAYALDLKQWASLEAVRSGSVLVSAVWLSKVSEAKPHCPRSSCPIWLTLIRNFFKWDFRYLLVTEQRPQNTQGAFPDISVHDAFKLHLV